MSSIDEEYEIGPIMKLIDLNNDVTNFELSFKVSTQSEQEFEMVVVNQALLDEGEIKYQKVKGELGGDIVRRDNVYQNFMIVLRSETPMKVRVQTQFKQLPLPIPDDNTQHDPQPVVQPEEISTGFPVWRTVLIVLIILIGCILVYYFYVTGDGKGFTGFGGSCSEGAGGAFSNAIDALKSLDIS